MAGPSGTTPVLNLPFPTPDDTVDVPRDIQALAQALDTLNGKLGGLTRLADTQLAVDAAAIDLTAIPQTHVHLLLVGRFRTAAAGTWMPLGLRLNGDTANAYANQSLVATGTTPLSGEGARTSAAALSTMPGATAPAGLWGVSYIIIPNYTLAGWVNVMLGMSGAMIGSVPPNNYRVDLNMAYWATGGGPINRLTAISLSGGNLLTGSRATLYGLR